ncbi:RNA polymerase sigma factor [Fimbriiglobus ruber]|uniref:High-affnity carbon uptake protein Hat/HatR n=1 Tax=Fimbriiglobus ruber TaxID=1908690 RepID=A0A225DLH3_9BACT|nr:sigma-70 family RNA polymerase sigma factor [Fimbriiglobus ruber]OWK37285.1 High-affnity carbon uptake protein Hat/HatR [Fimbriiglobus ruber]
MAAPALLRHVLTHSATADADAELLARFVANRDEAAFAELVNRHGPVVYRVCRRLVGPTGADDAFQATFLVLATRARAVRKAGAVGSWLVGVAARVARQMRRAALRRERYESAFASERSGLNIADLPPETADLGRILDDELTRLPDHLRGPVVACLLQGRTQEQAAADLRTSQRTVRRRLEEARRLLRSRLERRGVVPVVAAGLVAGAGQVPAAVPVELAKRTVAIVLDFLAGGCAVASSPAAIAKGVAMSTFAGKIKVVAAVVALGVAALGVGIAGDGKPIPPTPQLPAKEPIPPTDVAAPVPAAPRPTPPVSDSTLIPPSNIPIEPPAAADSKTARYQTTNFVIDAPTAEVARIVGDAAEGHRKWFAEDWLGHALPAWPRPCPITVRIVADKAGGVTTFSFGTSAGKPAVTAMEMRVSGELSAVLRDHLPHEVMHCVLATHFGQPLRRWVDEGVAALAEGSESRHAQTVRCRELLNAGRGIRLKVLMELTEYPKDMIVLLAEGLSVCEFLLTLTPDRSSCYPAYPDGVRNSRRRSFAGAHCSPRLLSLKRVAGRRPSRRSTDSIR